VDTRPCRFRGKPENPEIGNERKGIRVVTPIREDGKSGTLRHGGVGARAVELFVKSDLNVP